METDTDYDVIFGLSVVGSYEATEREVRPIYTNSSTRIAAPFFRGGRGHHPEPDRLDHAVGAAATAATRPIVSIEFSRKAYDGANACI